MTDETHTPNPEATAGAVAAAGKARRQTQEALIRAGIGDPVRSELLALPGITARLVDGAAEHTRTRGGRPGMTVNEIRARAEQAVQRMKDAAGRKAKLDTEVNNNRLRWEREQQERLAEKSKRDQIWKSLSEDQIQRLRKKVLSELDPWVRRKLDKPGIDPALRLMIVREHQQEAKVT